MKIVIDMEEECTLTLSSIDDSLYFNTSSLFSNAWDLYSDVERERDFSPLKPMPKTPTLRSVDTCVSDEELLLLVFFITASLEIDDIRSSSVEISMDWLS